MELNTCTNSNHESAKILNALSIPSELDGMSAADILEHYSIGETKWGKLIHEISSVSMGDDRYDIIADRLSVLSANWVTCACGKASVWIATDTDGGPIDPRLRAYGLYFYNKIAMKDWRGAAYALHLVENRAVQATRENQQ